MKIRKAAIAVGSILFLPLIALIALAAYDLNIVLIAGGRSSGERSRLAWNDEANRKQRGNTCGAHAAMAVIFTERNELVDPYRIYESIPEKLGRGYIYLWGITRYLDAYDLRMRSNYLGAIPGKARLEWMKRKLEDGHPVICIVGTAEYLHYVTVLGYEDDGLLVYDSNRGIDENGPSPGNITVSGDQLVENMESARFYGAPLNMALSF